MHQKIDLTGQTSPTKTERQVESEQAEQRLMADSGAKTTGTSNS